nr:gustatory receptor [Semanotus bifasciatus]
MSTKILVLILGMFFSFQGKVCGGGTSNSNCKNHLSQKNFQLIVNYANWRNIKNLVILEENIKLGCNFRAFRNTLKNFSKNKIYLSLGSSINHLSGYVADVKRKTIVITFYKSDSESDIIDQANKLTAQGEAISWLIILISKQNHILDHVRFANFSLDVDAVIAADTLWTATGSYSQISNYNCINNISTAGDKISKTNTFTPFLKNGNLTHSLSNFCHNGSMILEDSYCMLQIYKIRRICNSSLIVYPLGFWQLSIGTEYMKPFLKIEERGNFYQFPIVFGYKDSSQRNVNENIEEFDGGNDDNMREFISYFSLILNSSKSTVTYPKIGIKNNGEWTDLIGAIIKEEVDLGVDTISRTLEKCSDMAFTYNIMKFVRNIYIQPQESNDLRDIFLAPFDSRLIFCVGGVIFILAIVMSIFSRIVAKCKNMRTENQGNGFLDSFVWCIGIISQQGSIWTPGSCSEQIIVVVSLAFTLLIYNSYSAFITSILSVKRWDIRTVEDLLNSNYEIGYAKNSQDELYLRSMNVTQLNEIYLRGYLHNNINNVTEGLLKASKGNYAFFASGHVAKKQLLIINNYRCIHEIAEIPVQYTQNHVAFPMSKRSPYKKLINLSIIKMYETGIHKYIYSLLNPKLQKCEELRTYQSAGLPDLTAAFVMLCVGQILSIAILIGECTWKRKTKLYASLRKNIFHGRPMPKGH